ncbi:MAG: winged helix-turn-helix transcriptional regulator [Candidatus Aenigmarchaeota archaeon]|nr:winged helix-turn-helix transcriptional regulator [Candidatus Aenigmarchaeota archaeon]
MVRVTVQKSEDALKTFHLISNLTVKNIIECLKEGPAPPSEIARKVNISPSTASRCLQEMRKYNIVDANWKTSSIDERPLKMFRLVPNLLRFEYMIRMPESEPPKPEHIVMFSGNCVSEFRENDKRGVYVSIESVPFRFEGTEAEIIKECANEIKFTDLRKKFGDINDFESTIKKLLNLGIIRLKSSN